MEWFLAALKVVGLVGAYIGLIEPRKERTPSGLRLVAPVAFLVVAICAELYDARIKWKEGVVQAIRYEQLARSINKVAVDVDLTLPYAAIWTVAPEYGKRVRRYSGVDVVKDTGSMPLNAQDRDFPRAGIEGKSVDRDAYTLEARACVETEERLYLLDALHESPLFSERERSALAWIEAVTLVSETHVPDAVYDQTRQHFSETELINLTLCVAAINAWNRIVITFRALHPTHWKGRT